MKYALVINPEGAASMVQTDAKLEDLQTLVGGYIEYVGLSEGHAYVNEDGIPNGLMMNPLATLLARDFGFNPDGILFGPVVFLGNGGGEDDEANVPYEILAKFFK